MNRYQLESMRSGTAQELGKATEKLSTMYADTTTTIEARAQQKQIVADIKERLEGINAQIKEIDEESEKKLRKDAKINDSNPKNALITAKAELYRAAIQQRKPSEAARNMLVDTTDSGGDKFLPKTVAQEIISEPQVKNPLRGLSAMTAIPNLEIPRIAFTLDDDSFILDGETGKEIKATGHTVSFGRHKFKVFVDVSETVLLGTDANLTQVIDSGLESGLAKKEKKVVFDPNPTADYKHMSFYAKTGDEYDIKATKCAAGTSLYKAIKAAIADLEDDYRENATVVMRYSDYLDIIETLANGSATLYGVQPKQVLGVNAVFCDLATIPVVGDFNYSHYNYDIAMVYERDKNPKTGIESFVLTAWLDHQIKLKSAFRLATVLSA